MKSLEKKLIVGVVAVSILLVVTGVILYAALNDSNDKAAQVEHANEVLTEIEATLSTLKDAETGQRGYIITGKENYLEPFQLANEHTGERMERLKQLTENNSRHLERIAAAEPLIKTKFDLMNQTINLRRNSGFEAAQRVVMTNQGKNTMDAIRVLFGAMKDDETALLQNLKVTSETKVRQVIITFVVMFVLIFSLFCLVYFLVKRDIGARNLLADKLRQLATTDELTGIYNRREANRLLKQETTRFRRYNSQVSILLLDIDYFKSVNDNYGHQIGDEVLRWVSQNLLASIRGIDSAARFGGEEFIVILPETNSEGALITAERARQKIAETPFVLQKENGQTMKIPITVSIGVAVATDDFVPTDEEFIDAADKALYQAKKAGRNRVVISNQKIQTVKSKRIQAVA